MSQYLSVMGAIDASKFVVTSGVAKPKDFPTLYIFQEMQHQLDRVAQAKNIAKIAPDGDIGPATLRLVAAAGPFMMVDASSVASVAANADQILTLAKAKADGLGAPEKVTTPVVIKQPSISTPTGPVAAPPMPPVGAGASVMDTFKSLGTVGMLAGGAAIIGVGYYLTKKKGRR